MNQCDIRAKRRAAMERLPEDYRQVLMMRYQDQLPFEEIAQKLGRTANAVRKLWARAVERLEVELEREDMASGTGS
jgi:RNA polymerase sigma-70 factor (ECF subfamily)